MDTAEILRQGRDRIEQGWMRGSMFGPLEYEGDGSNATCAWLALKGHHEAVETLSRVVDDNWLERVQAAHRLFMEQNPNFSDESNPLDDINRLIYFNNHRDTTRDEVLAAYDKAIAQAEELI